MRIVRVAALGALVGCGSSEPIRVLGDLTIEIQTAVFVDTVDAALPTPITATVLASDGLPVADTSVIFLQPFSRVFFGASPGPATVGNVTVKTDANGAAQAYMKLGGLAGSYLVRAMIKGTTVVDSLTVEIRGGKAVSFRLMPRDSTLYVDGTYALRATRLDRHGNASSSTPAYESRSASVVSVEDSVARGVTFGIATIFASVDALKDSVRVVTVPRGSAVAYPERSGGLAGPGVLYLFELDGSLYRPLNSTGPNGTNARAPRWSPSGDRIVYQEAIGIGLHLFSVTPAGETPIQLTPALPGAQELYPQYSRDGQWLFYSAYSESNQSNTIWRATPSATNAVQLGPAPGVQTADYAPSPSPDGSRLAYLTNRVGFDPRLRILTIANGAINALDLVAWAPRWSPVSDEVAFIADGDVKVVNASTGVVSTVNDQHGFLNTDGQIDWSPDGTWLISCAVGGTSGDRYLVIVRRSDGLALPLAWSHTNKLCQASWKP